MSRGALRITGVGAVNSLDGVSSSRVHHSSGSLASLGASLSSGKDVEVISDALVLWDAVESVGGEALRARASRLALGIAVVSSLEGNNAARVASSLGVRGNGDLLAVGSVDKCSSGRVS